MAAAGTGREPFTAVTMNANKELLRERLGAIMSCKKKTKLAEMFPQEMIVAMHACRIRDGAGEAFQVVDLIPEGETVTVLGKKGGKDGQMWYLLDKNSLTARPDDSVKECYIRVDLLRK